MDLIQLCSAEGESVENSQAKGPELDGNSGKYLAAMKPSDTEEATSYMDCQAISRKESFR